MPLKNDQIVPFVFGVQEDTIEILKKRFQNLTAMELNQLGTFIANKAYDRMLTAIENSEKN